MGCFSGRLMSAASDQKLFCKLCSPFCCSFNEFVEEKVISPSYSSAILTPPPPLHTFLDSWLLSRLIWPGGTALNSGSQVGTARGGWLPERSLGSSELMVAAAGSQRSHPSVSGWKVLFHPWGRENRLWAWSRVSSGCREQRGAWSWFPLGRPPAPPGT